MWLICILTTIKVMIEYRIRFWVACIQNIILDTVKTNIVAKLDIFWNTDKRSRPNQSDGRDNQLNTCCFKTKKFQIVESNRHRW